MARDPDELEDLGTADEAMPTAATDELLARVALADDQLRHLRAWPAGPDAGAVARACDDVQWIRAQIAEELRRRDSR